MSNNTVEMPPYMAALAGKIETYRKQHNGKPPAVIVLRSDIYMAYIDEIVKGKYSIPVQNFPNVNVFDGVVILANVTPGSSLLSGDEKFCILEKL